jgi:hypothetical protein
VLRTRLHTRYRGGRTAPPFTADLWVGPTGSDSGNGTRADPLDLQTAINWADPGSTIAVEDGTYTPASLISVYEGKDNLIIRAAPGARPLFDAINYPTPDDFNSRAILLQNVSGVTVSGLSFTNGPDGGMQIIDCDDVTIFGCDLWGNGRRSLFEGSGLTVRGSVSNLLVMGCDAYFNHDVLGTPAGFNADGFQISVTGTGNRILFCRAWNNSDDGFDLFNQDQNGDFTPSGVEVGYCWAYRNGYRSNGAESEGDGNGFKIGGQQPSIGNGSGDHFVHNSMAWGNRTVGFTDNGSTLPNRLFNNTGYDNGRINFEGNSVAHRFVNNVGLIAGEDNVSIANASASDRNSWQLFGDITTSEFLSVDDDSAIAARPVVGGMPPTYFLTPSGSSRLRNAGIDVGLYFQGLAPDLGPNRPSS